MDQIETTLSEGGAVVLPTETVYGLFAKALDEEAVKKVYRLKQRPLDKAMNLNIASYEEILAYSKNQPLYLEKLVKSFLPGPLTIILEANDKVPNWINSGLKTVGFRMPNHPRTLEYIAKQGPLIGPSANPSGQASGINYEAIMDAFHHQVIGLKDDYAILGQDSTILDLTSTPVRVLRQGELTLDDIFTKIPELQGDKNDI